jgi:hypothetical protein
MPKRSNQWKIEVKVQGRISKEKIVCNIHHQKEILEQQRQRR